MKISAVSVLPVLNTNSVNRKNNLLIPLKNDTVSFSHKPSLFLYNYAWYLKDKQIIEQDDFSTTIEDNSQKRTIIDKLKGKKYTKKIYDLPLRLREELSETQNDTVVCNVPEDVLKESCLSNSDFIKNIDKINAFINLVYPRYDINEDETKQKFQMKLGNTVATVSRIAQGMSGIIYKIEVPDCKPLCLKHFLHNYDINISEGAFPEIAIAKKMNEDNVRDIPLMYCANPYNGWMLSEYVTPDYECREDGIPFGQYIKNNHLYCNDVNDGMTVGAKNSYIFVDFGYIYAKGSEREISGFTETVDKDRKNNANEYSDDRTAVLSAAENVFLHGDDEIQDDFYQKYFLHPEFQFLSLATEAIEKVLSSERIPYPMVSSLQKYYEEAGFIGNVVDIISSCNQ